MSTSSLNAPIITEEYARQELESLTIDERHQLHQDLYGCPRSSCCYNSGGTGGSNGGCCNCSANNVSVTSSVSNSQATVQTTSNLHAVASSIAVSIVIAPSLLLLLKTTRSCCQGKGLSTQCRVRSSKLTILSLKSSGGKCNGGCPHIYSTDTP